jgi:Fe-S oxidoreductase
LTKHIPLYFFDTISEFEYENGMFCCGLPATKSSEQEENAKALGYVM